MDPETSIFIRDFLVNYKRLHKSSIIITSHNLDEIQSICSEIILLKSGEIDSLCNLEFLLQKNKYSSLEEFFSRAKLMFGRIFALIIRYKTISLVLSKGVSIFYWPSVQILFWGFFSNFLIQNNSSSVFNVAKYNFICRCSLGCFI